jgi:hypothetical protein
MQTPHTPWTSLSMPSLDQGNTRSQTKREMVMGSLILSNCCPTTQMSIGFVSCYRYVWAEADDQNKRKRSGSPASERDGKIAKIVKAHIIQASTERSKPLLTKPNRNHDNSTFSSIEVWHPTAGQKSYGKERRYVYPNSIDLADW